MKNIFSVGSRHLLVLTLIMALVVLAACSSTTATTTAPAPTTTMPPPTTTTNTTPVPTTTTPSSTTGQSITINLVAQGMAFDQKTITVPASAQVTMNFNNKDGLPHNFALYNDSSATKSIFVGEIISGPKTITYTFTAPATPGNYFFRCDVHPTNMTGTFVVQ